MSRLTVDTKKQSASGSPLYGKDHENRGKACWRI